MVFPVLILYLLILAIIKTVCQIHQIFQLLDYGGSGIHVFACGCVAVQFSNGLLATASIVIETSKLFGRVPHYFMRYLMYVYM